MKTGATCPGRGSRRGSALVMAIWILAVLSIMVVSFAFEARQQAGINIYVQERNRVKRLIEPGRVLGEIVMLGYSEAKEWTEDEDEKEMDEEDRFYKEKRALKFQTCWDHWDQQWFLSPHYGLPFLFSAS